MHLGFLSFIFLDNPVRVPPVPVPHTIMSTFPENSKIYLNINFQNLVLTLKDFYFWNFNVTLNIYLIILIAFDKRH